MQTQTKPTRASRAAIAETFDDLRPFLQKLASKIYGYYKLQYQGVGEDDVEGEVNLAFVSAYHEFIPGLTTIEKFLSVRVWQKVVDAFRTQLKWWKPGREKRVTPRVVPLSSLPAAFADGLAGRGDAAFDADPEVAEILREAAGADRVGVKPREVRREVRRRLVRDRGWENAQVSEAFRRIRGDRS